MRYKTAAVALGVACFLALPAAYAFEIVTDNSGFGAPAVFLGDPDGDSDMAAVGNPFISALGPYEYHVPADAFDKGYSFSGYAFEDEKLADHSAEAKTEEQPAVKADNKPAPKKQSAAAAKH